MGRSCASAFGGRSQAGAWDDAARAPGRTSQAPGARLLPGTRSEAGPPDPAGGASAHGPQGMAIAGGFPRGRPG